MSWSTDIHIGELRPWPEAVIVRRGETDETRRYVPEEDCSECARGLGEYADGLCDPLKRENAKLREEFRKMDEWHSKELIAAMDENAELRELVRKARDELVDMYDHMDGCYAWPTIEEDPYYGPLYVRLCSELGIEVDG